jgi:hypothetical protein
MNAATALTAASSQSFAHQNPLFHVPRPPTPNPGEKESGVALQLFSRPTLWCRAVAGHPRSICTALGPAANAATDVPRRPGPTTPACARPRRAAPARQSGVRRRPPARGGLASGRAAVHSTRMRRQTQRGVRTGRPAHASPPAGPLAARRGRSPRQHATRGQQKTLLSSTHLPRQKNSGKAWVRNR